MEMKFEEVKDAKTVLKYLSESGIGGLNEKEIDRCISLLCKSHVPYTAKSGGDMRVIVASQLLNTAKQQLFIQRIEEENQNTQNWFKVLAIGSLAIGALSFPWQAGIDTHKLCRFVLPEHMTSKCGEPKEMVDIQEQPQPSQSSKETNP